MERLYHKADFSFDINEQLDINTSLEPSVTL